MNFIRRLAPAVWTCKPLPIVARAPLVAGLSKCRCAALIGGRGLSQGSSGGSSSDSDSSWKSNIPPPPTAPKPFGIPNAPSYDPPFADTMKPPVRLQSKNVAPPTYEKALLEELGIANVDPFRIAQVLAEENITIGELKMLVEMRMHEAKEESYFSDDRGKSSDEFTMDNVSQLNPKRAFYPGQTYNPEDLSPETVVDFNKLRRETRRKGCPLGGKKGPKIDFANVALLSRFVTDSGKIISRRKSRVCSKKQRELRTAIKRARFINLMPYLHKLPEYARKEGPATIDF